MPYVLWIMFFSALFFFCTGLFFITVYPFFSISKSSVIFHQFCMEKNQVHFIYYAYNMYGYISIRLHKYCSWHLSCCFLSTLVLFSGSDYMIHKWVIIPGKEARSQWQYVSVYFRLVRSMGVLPEILCPVLTGPSSRTKQDWTWTKGSQVTLTGKHLELSCIGWRRSCTVKGEK